MQTAYFAGGWFWCVEAVFQRIQGVALVESGDCNGSTIDPTYQDICTGSSGHAEVVKIEFDETIVSFEDLLQVFFATHDATTLNQQGNDRGTQYRSAVFYTAEDYHQNYYNNNPNQPYCAMLITPKLDKYFK